METNLKHRDRSGNLKLRAGVAIAVLVLGVSFLLALNRFRKRGNNAVAHKLQEVLADPIKFATNRFVGGIGAVLIMDSGRGLPQVHDVIEGSPAAAAGLQSGDYLIKIGDSSMTGKTLAVVVDLLRGVTFLKATIEIERHGTNLICRVGRESWETLRGKAR